MIARTTGFRPALARCAARCAPAALVLAAGLASGCASGPELPEIDPLPPVPWMLEPELARLASWLEGSFVTPDRKERLDCARIWTAREGLWMIVERRAPSRVGSLAIEVWSIERRSDASVLVHVHDPPAPIAEFKGTWREPARVATIGPKDLEPRPELALTLLDRGRSFQGGTLDTSPAVDLRLWIGEDRVLWQRARTGETLTFERLP